ncbi:MAG TPA: hypothetical protein VNN73_04940 [Blastocatellia bacterium]|nr:hypothetical protein [Blastocatellia bacterium]
MKTNRMIATIILAIVALWHRSDGQPQRPIAEQMRLAGVMPRGALVYVQARDLNALMKTWMASPVRDRFYKSKSYTAFTHSRVYLKLQDRMNDFEKAVGFGLNEARVAELAGGLSAVSIYDIGKLEMVFVTEVSRERAIATSMFKLAPQFEERSADGSVYYVRDVTSDGGRLNQQFCFAHTGNKLILTTTEGLMIRALKNAKAPADDSLLVDVMALAGQARGFSPHELTLWLDQTRLNQNRHFNNYWIHHNVGGALANIESGLVDLRITPEGLNEHRWFKLGGGDQGAGGSVLAANQVSALMKFAPADAQFIEVHTKDKGLGATVSQAFFGKLPDEAQAQGVPPDHSYTESSDGEEESRPRGERYGRLDARFDMDVDDEQALRQGGRAPSKKRPQSSEEDERFAKAVAAILDKLSPAAYSEIIRSKASASSPFVRFERAVVIEMAGAGLDRNALERAIIDEMRARYVITGIQPQLAWQEEASVRYVAQSLLEQGAAYAVSGKYLVLASNKEFAHDILQAATAPATDVARVDGPVSMYAVVRIADAKPVFDKLMTKLDGKTEAKPADSEEEEGEANVSFFSENLSSLVSASAIREMRMRRERNGAMMIERVVYSW